MISQEELRDASYVHRLTCVASHVIAGRHVKTDEKSRAVPQFAVIWDKRVRYMAFEEKS